jgi:hypothetical protein
LLESRMAFSRWGATRLLHACYSRENAMRQASTH